ncbi:MAG: hypothetical protein M1814_004551 [Vezdaea aestivalis]|nr:MAG: hypothetical protein M1814_004551 [Vezdaea aestivalis]
MAAPPRIPITIVTGFLGAGKTTLILSLIPQLPKSYKLALLKNEFGTVATDSLLASSASIAGTTELLNGCICCNLVGQLRPALLELAAEHAPDRILIETSGSAFPATLAMEVVRAGEETGRLELDGVVVVVDCEEWKGYEDKSPTAKMQARWTDLMVLNKWEDVGESRLDDVLDRIGDLDVGTPVVKSRRGLVDVGVVFGLDSGLARMAGKGKGGFKAGGEGHEAGHDHEAHQSEVDVLEVVLRAKSSTADGLVLSEAALKPLLESAPKDEVYRMKAVFRSKSGLKVLNWAFGRSQLTGLSCDDGGEVGLDGADVIRMTVILDRDCGTRWKKKIDSGTWMTVEEPEKVETDLVVTKIV